MPSGKSNTSGSENGAVVNQPRPSSQMTGGFRHSSIVVQIEKVGAKSEALDDQVRTVADPDLVDLREELVGGVAGEDVRGARLDPDADEGQQPLVLPGGRALELVVAELDADLLVRPRRMRLGERHGHVEVGHARFEARVEDGDVEQRIDRVQDRVRPRLADQLDDSVLARGVDCVRAEAPVVEPGDDSLRPGGVVVRERAMLEERAPRGDPRERRSHTTSADDEHPHGAGVLHERGRLSRHPAPGYAPASFRNGGRT
jgi:hypothetical protein